jgi:hypothetical protein
MIILLEFISGVKGDHIIITGVRGSELAISDDGKPALFQLPELELFDFDGQLPGRGE